MAATTESDIKLELKEMRNLLEKASKPRTNAASVLAGATPGGFESRGVPRWNDLDYNTYKRLEAVGEAYKDTASGLAFSPNAKRKCLGWGEHLIALADSAGHPTRFRGAYKDLNKLEEKMGFTHVSKAFRTTKGINGEVIKTALAENSGSAGGYVVPPQFMTDLLTIAGEDAFIEPRCKILPMTSRTAQWPMLDITTAQATGTTPYAGGVLGLWQPEASSISETEPAFRQTEWTAYDLVLYAVSSNQLLADNGIGLDALLTQLFAWAITWYKEYAFIQGLGAGSSMPLGILNAPASLGVTKLTSAHITYSDIVAMMSKLQVRSWDSAIWVAHQSALPDLLQLNAENLTASAVQTVSTHLSWLPHVGEGGVGPAGMKLPRVLLNGLPLYFTEKMPTMAAGHKPLMLVDLSMYVIGQRLDYQIDVSPHFLFKNNQLAWRVIARCDAKPWLNGPIVDSQGYSSSPFVYLND
jgi:predicted phage gp36 major capsid-like protein